MSEFSAMTYEFVQTDHAGLLAIDKILQNI